jgi:hypothetical protein
MREDLTVDEKLLLKWTFNKYEINMQTWHRECNEKLGKSHNEKLSKLPFSLTLIYFIKSQRMLAESNPLRMQYQYNYLQIC